MSEREELEERVTLAQIALNEAQEEFDIAAHDLDMFNAASPGAEAADETEPPA